jgi:hypothetical protein
MPEIQGYTTGSKISNLWEATVTPSDREKYRLDTNTVFSDTGAIDAFGRLRVSNPTTLFDSKQVFDNQALFWDDEEVSGGSTTTTHNANQASTTIAVGASTAGNRVRQTFQRFNYQPGKSQLVLLTGVFGAGATGITKSIGYFDDDNGLFFELAETTLNVVRRTKTSGSVVDNKVAQSSWNIDTMDGNGPSGITLDLTKTQIMLIDFEWLGVGRVRMGWVIDGMIYYCHEFKNANNLTTVYMSTPNLPLRYEIDNDGSGGASSLVHICSSVMSEGGLEKLGVLRHADSGSIGSLKAGSLYGGVGIRLSSSGLGTNVLLENLSLLSSTANDQAHWEIILNPAVASGTWGYSGLSNSPVQVALGNGVLMSGGTVLDGGYFTTSLPITTTTPNALRLGAKRDGTVDTLVLTIKPITNNITAEASLTWRELL